MAEFIDGGKGSMFDLRISNNEFVIQYLRNIQQKTKDALREEIGQSLYTIEANAKIDVPVNTSALRQSIQVELFQDKIGGKVECAENIDPHIGAYVEFGTGSMVQIPEGLEAYAMTFYVNGKGRLPAKPFLFPAFFAEQEDLLYRLKILLR